MKKFLALILVLVMVVSLCACGKKAEDTGMSICIITTSGVDDGSFNENCYDGIQAFLAEHPDCTVTDVKEEDTSKVIATIDALAGDYDIFVLPGFNFAACGETIEANPDKYYIVVDSTVTYADGSAASFDNAYTMTFSEQQSAFPVGIAAALKSETGKVAVVNGIAFPSNVNYQYGFMAGVQYANKVLGTSVECIELPSYSGTDVLGNAVGGNYVGDFADPATGKDIAKTLIEMGCDVIFAAAGSSGNGCMAACQEAGVYFIGCDVDQFDDCPDVCLTSTLKIMDQNIQLQLNKIYDGSFEGKDDYLDCNNNGVGYVSADGRCALSAEDIEAINAGFALVQSGEIVVPADATVNEYTPDNYPGK